MKRILVAVVALTSIPLLTLFLVWYWFTPHKHPTVKLAEKGDVQAMYLVGVAYITARGGGIIQHPNVADSIFWLRKASEKGHRGAMWTISGLGIPDEEKVMWLKKGAELGSGACMTELANGYLHQNLGLPKDIGAYVYWEGRRSEIDMKAYGLTPEEVQQRLQTGEKNLCDQLKYHGPVRPLP